MDLWVEDQQLLGVQGNAVDLSWIKGDGVSPNGGTANSSILIYFNDLFFHYEPSIWGFISGNLHMKGGFQGRMNIKDANHPPTLGLMKLRGGRAQ